MNKLRTALKNFILQFFYFLRPAQRIFPHAPEVVVLMYHSVSEADWKHSVRPVDFKKQIDYLCREKHIVPFGDIVAFIDGKKDLRDGSVAITFDDGYADIYSEVFPVVREKNIPITVFLTTNLDVSPSPAHLPRPSWNELEEMARSGLVAFEIHGHNHIKLNSISSSEESLRQEILDCKQAIQNKLGQNPTYAAYAYGRRDARVVDFLRNNGIAAACTISENLVTNKQDAFQIPRIQVDRTINFPMFIIRLTSAVSMKRKIFHGA